MMRAAIFICPRTLVEIGTQVSVLNCGGGLTPASQTLQPDRFGTIDEKSAAHAAMVRHC
jgi:hypothetical protein